MNHKTNAEKMVSVLDVILDSAIEGESFNINEITDEQIQKLKSSLQTAEHATEILKGLLQLAEGDIVKSSGLNAPSGVPLEKWTEAEIVQLKKALKNEK